MAKTFGSLTKKFSKIYYFTLIPITVKVDIQTQTYHAETNLHAAGHNKAAETCPNHHSRMKKAALIDYVKQILNRLDHEVVNNVCLKYLSETYTIKKFT